MSVQPHSADMRRGWCPGALTPMQTGDGWLVRVRPRNGSYSLAQLTAIAEAAHKHGNGEIDLTSRANLQIRGLLLGSVVKVQAILREADLIDETPADEAARNIMIAPLAGIDPTAIDVRPLAHKLEQALRGELRLQALPSKFNFAVDGGGCFSLDPGLADITLRASRHDVAIELAGAGDGPVAKVPATHAVAAAVGLALHFVETRSADPDIRRMRDLVQSAGAASIFRYAKLTSTAQSRPANSPLPIGELVSGLGPVNVPLGFGIGLPFGRISASDLFTLVAALQACNIGEVRPAPSRILVMPLLSDTGAQHATTAENITAAVAKLGLITSSADPRLAMDVCPGAPACERGTTPTRADAERLAKVLPANTGSIHVSGCAKGCARQNRAWLTFVARNGCYDVVTKGAVSDAPTRVGIPGERLAAVVTELTGGPRG